MSISEKIPPHLDQSMLNKRTGVFYLSLKHETQLVLNNSKNVYRLFYICLFLLGLTTTDPFFEATLLAIFGGETYLDCKHSLSFLWRYWSASVSHRLTMHGLMRATASLFSRPRMHAWLVGSVSGLLVNTVSTVFNLVVPTFLCIV